jgi:acyl phosphate:glycerol-3-phosphate acyltransferase
VPGVLLLLPLAYLLGSIPTAALVARVTGHDILREGSGNPGASNVYRLAGWKAGVIAFAGDFAKGAIPSAVGLILDGHRGAYILGFAAVVGHVFPIMYRFRGGRGASTAGGALAVIFPLIALGLAVLWFVIARLTRKASVASIIGAIAFPVLVALTGNSWGDVLITSALALVVLARHASNLRRLVRGEEPGLGRDPPGGSVSR